VRLIFGGSISSYAQNIDIQTHRCVPAFNFGFQRAIIGAVHDWRWKVDYHWEVYATHSIRRLQSGCDAAIEKKRIGQREHWVPILPSSAE